MSDQVTIYLIVVLNIFCQVVLIWRQKLAKNVTWILCFLAVAIPILIMVSMRLLIAGGAINGQVAEQSLIEQYITKGSSIMLIAGPWLVTVVAIYIKLRNRARLLAETRKNSPEVPPNSPQ